MSPDHELFLHNKGFDRRMHKKDPSKAGAEAKVVAMEEQMKQRLYKKNQTRFRGQL